MISHVLLDMDGVLCDFVSAAMRVHGFSYDEALWPEGQDALFDTLGVSVSEFWREIDRFDEEQGFWARLKAYSWFQDLVAMVEPIGFTIATSPSSDPFCASGKVQWLHRHFGETFNNYMVGSQKSLLAARGRVLIDDRDKECDRFREAGGEAIVFPQPWNSNHAHCTDRLTLSGRNFNAFKARRPSQNSNNRSETRRYQGIESEN